MLNEILLVKDLNSYKPKNFINAFGVKHKKFKGSVQHDAQEFLRVLLEDISSDLNRVKNIPIYRELKSNHENKTMFNKDFHNLFIEREDSVIIDLFYGQICNIFACEMCDYKTFSFEKIMDIPILLGKIII